MPNDLERTENQNRPDEDRRHNPRSIAAKILTRVDRTDSYLDKLLDIELRSSDLNDLDKSLLNELANGVLRHQAKLDWVLRGFYRGDYGKIIPQIRNTLRVALYQILFLDKIPHHAAVNEAVEYIKRLRGEKSADMVNAVLRNIIRNLDGIRYPTKEDNPIQYLTVNYSHPSWMVKRWVEMFGFYETEALLQANNRRPATTLRINPLKIVREQFLSLFQDLSVIAIPSKYVIGFLKVEGLAGVSNLESFKKGFFSIQDESAGLACVLLAPQPNERVIDLCAAPGGKTTFMAEMMNNTGEIVAVDKYVGKLDLIQSSCNRLGIHNVRTLVGDAANVDLDPADKVLLDAPCSGLGVLAKKPDMKWKRDSSDIQKLAKLQLGLLENAAESVKPGGTIVYSTCTTEPEENTRIIETFCEKNPGFTVDSAIKYVHPDVVNEKGCIETYPHRQQMDGSFAARIIRNR
jgi:16S rRNA (cytosine967-C5)-methyltransferase